MHQAAPDQGTWDFDDDGRHVCFGKKVLATLKRLRFEPLFFPERFSENIKGHGVACKQVGHQAGVSPIAYFLSGIVRGLSLESTTKTANRLAGLLSLAFSLIL